MKKWLVFLIGIFTGILFAFPFTIALIEQLETHTVKDDGVIMFEQPGDVINEKSFKVFQSLKQGSALAKGDKEWLTVFMLSNDEGKYYYDDEKVIVPFGKVARQVGVYQYQTKEGFSKTVPIVKFMGK